MKKAVMKKAPTQATKMLTLPEYNEKVKSLDSDDPALDDWVDLTTQDAKQLAAKERKRVAQALLAAAAVLEGATVPKDIVEALEMVRDDVQKAITLAKRGQFAKAQDTLESALGTGNLMLQDGMFQDADDAKKLEDTSGGDQPSWLTAAKRR
jgi:hypothetical protein